jgi:hypothetical protein
VLLVALVLGQLSGPIFPTAGKTSNPWGYATNGGTGPVFVEPESYAFFEFAPASGAGMGTACAGTAVTGAKGEALSMTRGSSAMCSKQGAATTGIATGDLVACSNDTPRIEASNGVLSYLREPGATNNVRRSQELNDGSWAKVGSAGVPVVTANYAVAPDNTMTAERVQFNACTPGLDSVVYQPACSSGLTNTGSIYLKGNGTSGTIQVFINLGTTSACIGCDYNSATWTRCAVTGMVVSVGNFVIGPETAAGYNCQGTSQPAADVLVWGAQCEVGSVATSYIPTTSAAASRSADSALTGTLPVGVGPNFSLAGSVAYLGAGVASTLVQLGSAAPNIATLGVATNTQLDLLINAAATGPSVSAIGTTTHRGSLSDASGTRSAYWDGSSVLAPAGSMTGTATAVTIGAVSGRTSLVYIDPDPSRCR